MLAAILDAILDFCMSTQHFYTQLYVWLLLTAIMCWFMTKSVDNYNTYTQNYLFMYLNIRYGGHLEYLKLPKGGK